MAGTTEPTQLTETFERALRRAIKLHRNQTRKGSNIPYVSHLLGVASLVLDDDGSEEDAIAALLHDAIEDPQATLADFEAELGPELGGRIYAVVEACSDDIDNRDVTRDDADWRERKEQYLVHLADPSVSESVLRVSAADKLHNARAILADLREHGATIFDRFNAGAPEQLWYYRSLVGILAARYPRPITRELAATVAEIGRVAAVPETGPEASGAPLLFDCFIGGMGLAYRVHVEGDDVVHEAFKSDEPVVEKRRRPRRAGWARFWQSLDDVGAWDWAGSYTVPDVMDGTGWSITILHGDRLLAAGGSNGYPPTGGGADPGPVFEQFLRAVSRLAGAPFR